MGMSVKMSACGAGCTVHVPWGAWYMGCSSHPIDYV